MLAEFLSLQALQDVLKISWKYKFTQNYQAVKITFRIESKAFVQARRTREGRGHAFLPSFATHEDSYGAIEPWSQQISCKNCRRIRSPNHRRSFFQGSSFQNFQITFPQIPQTAHIIDSPSCPPPYPKLNFAISVLCSSSFAHVAIDIQGGKRSFVKKIIA